MSASVLVVDDSITIRMDLTAMLTAGGFAVTACATLLEARARLAEQSYALLVLDVLLPDGDGVEFLRELRTGSGPQPPVMLLSSEAEVGDRVRGLSTGAEDYVGKPYDAGYVVARAHELVRRDKKAAAAEATTILVVDDSPTFREALRDAFEGQGHRVVVAASGEEGLRLAADLRPAAIVVDGVLPGIHGATVIRRVRLDSALRATPCLLLTGAEEADAELSALEAGADAFVRKDEDMAVILARLAAVLRSSGPAKAHPEAAGMLGPKKILAIDDSPTYLNALANSLLAEGYDVSVASSGAQALELLKVQPVDCILLDLVMPDLDGYETCAHIKSDPLLRDTPLIMLTGIDEREAMIRGLEAGADDYVAKSSGPALLKARVVAQLRRKQFEDETRKIRERLLRTELEAAEARAARALAETRARLIVDIEQKNAELEAFSYSVSHDLRAPLRSIDGFSQALLEDHLDRLDEKGKNYLQRIRAAAQRMGELIDDLLELSRVGRAEMRQERTDLSSLARSVIEDLRRSEPGRAVDARIEAGVVCDGDPRLLRIVLENLLGNAWKFSSKKGDARIEFGVVAEDGAPTYFVRDNGVGFDMAYAERLFSPFQRLHTVAEFPGTGIGLATVQRIVSRHEGRLWAESTLGAGAAFHWTLRREP